MHDQPQPAPRLPAALKASRRAAPEHVPHQEPEIEGAGVDDQPLEDVRMPAQVNPAQPAGVIDIGKRPFHVLPSAPHQAFPPRSAHSTPIFIYRLLCPPLLRPPTPAPIRLPVL